ncbi:hypothetical protein D3C85_873950 [compost metagenome]
MFPVLTMDAPADWPPAPLGLWSSVVPLPAPPWLSAPTAAPPATVTLERLMLTLP